MRQARTIFWNVWGPRHPDRVFSFLKQRDADIVCLTEVTSSRYQHPSDAVVHSSTNPDEPPAILDGIERLTEQFGTEYHIFYSTPPV